MRYINGLYEEGTTKTNIIRVVVLVVIGGLIIGLSVHMTKTAKITSPASPSGGPSGRLDRSGEPEEVVSKPPAVPKLPPESPTPAPKPIQPAPALVTEIVLTTLERTFEKGIDWLMNQQLVARGDPEETLQTHREDGAWPDLEGKPDVAFTALTLICLGQATEAYREKYQTPIEKGVKYLLGQQQLDGSIIDSGKIPSFSTYKTPLALVALMSLDRTDKYLGAILLARDYLEGAQCRDSQKKELYGGWGYKEADGETTPNPNMSTTQYVIEALRKANLPADSKTWQRAVEFLQRCQDASEYNDFRITLNSGGFFYSPVESKAGEQTLPDGTKVLKPYGSMTYAGLMSFIYAYVDKDDPRVRSTYNWLRRHYTLDENPGLRTDVKPELGKQGLFYYYHTFAKALDAYGEKIVVSLPDNQEHFWAEELVKKLAALQKPDGSWSNEESRWWEDFAPLATSYSLMTLNICRKWVE